MEMIAQYFAADTGIIMATNHKVINVTDSGSVAEGLLWWEELTNSGGEGMVVKPFDFTVKNNRELLQPAKNVGVRNTCALSTGRNIRWKVI